MRRRSAPAPLGDAVLSIAVHLHVAGDDQATLFASCGFTTADVERALRIASTPLAEQEAAEARAGQLLIAMRAPGISVEHLEIRTFVTDETPAERSQRMEGAGWFDAIMHRAVRDLPRAEDAEAYSRGRSAFLAVLADSLREAA